jgi:hypothetical protein
VQKTILLAAMALLLLFSCKKYKDPDPQTDPRIQDLYCNDPSAINYNWNFPGIPDNTTCFYPSDVFAGNYTYYDSTLNDDLDVIAMDTFTISLVKIDTVRMTLSGFCTGAPLSITADQFLRLVLDSIDGDGQQLCLGADTMIGGGKKVTVLDTTNITFSYEIESGNARTTHKGTAIKQ